MKKFFLLALCTVFIQIVSHTQNVGIGTTTPNTSAALDISTTSKGLLIPRMTPAGITAIPNPAKGLMLYDSVNSRLMINMGTADTPDWESIIAGAGWNFYQSNHFLTAIGYGAEFTTIQRGTDAFNTAVGYQALYNNTDGYENTAIGLNALTANTVGTLNTALGYRAGVSQTAGYNNTFIGAQSDIATEGLQNCISIGFVSTCTGTNQARIGNSITSSIGGFANWTNISDGRFKKDIREDVKGLDFIMKLRPVTYHLDISGISNKLNENRGKEMNASAKQAIIQKESLRYSGFIAQEVEAAAAQTGYDFSGVDKPKNDNDFYGLRYAEFVVPVIKAMQEQQQTIDALKNQNELLRQQNTLILKRLEALENKK